MTKDQMNAVYRLCMAARAFSDEIVRSCSADSDKTLARDYVRSALGTALIEVYKESEERLGG